MAATSKPVRKAIKKRITSLNKFYKSDPDVKISGMGKTEIKHMKKEDKPSVKKIVKSEMSRKHSK